MSAFETQFLQPAQSGKWDDIKGLLDVEKPFDWSAIQPTKAELLEYLNLCGGAGQAGQDESKRVVPSVEAGRALTNVAKWIESGPSSCFDASRINVNRAALQLAARICWPTTLNQGGCGFCGPTTMLYDFAERAPLAYAQCGMDLIRTGGGEIKINCGITSLQIDVDPATEVTDMNGTPEMDFLMMRGIRKRAELLVTAGSTGGANFNFNVQDSHATTPKQVAQVLRNSGYTEVKDCTIGWPGNSAGPPSASQRSVNLLTCSFLCKMRPRPIVIMLMEGGAAEEYFRNGHLPPSATFSYSSQLATLHWVVVEDLDASGTVTGKMVTWTRTKNFNFNKDDFLHYYYGYVTGKP